MVKGKTMATPLNMPRKATKRVVRVTMAARHAHCADKGRCTGPGCKANTGKTDRKGFVNRTLSGMDY